jgi:hypothetical protein
MFRIVKIIRYSVDPHKTLPGIDSCCTDADTPSLTLGAKPLQWAVTPKLTMIAGRQLSIGAFPVRNALLDYRITDRYAE